MIKVTEPAFCCYAATDLARARMAPVPTPVCRIAMIHDRDGDTICIHKRKAEH